MTSCPSSLITAPRRASSVTSREGFTLFQMVSVSNRIKIYSNDHANNKYPSFPVTIYSILTGSYWIRGEVGSTEIGRVVARR